MRRIALLVVVPLLSLFPARADALTVRDILELTRAGLGEEILLTLIDVDRSVFPIDTATLKRLKEAGVSERVILAMIRSARMPAPMPEPIAVAEPAPAPEPQVIVIDHHDPPQIREVPVAVPIYVPFIRRAVRRSSVAGRQDFVQESFAPPSELDRFAGASVHTPPVKPAEPVYWGFGGKLRPDAWQPSPDTTIKADTTTKPDTTIKKKQN
jgi:hypothetical protein